MRRVRIEGQVQLLDQMLRAIGVKVDLLTDCALSLGMRISVRISSSKKSREIRDTPNPEEVLECNDNHEVDGSLGLFGQASQCERETGIHMPWVHLTKNPDPRQRKALQPRAFRKRTLERPTLRCEFTPKSMEGRQIVDCLGSVGEQANALIELGLRSPSRMTPHKRPSVRLTCPSWSMQHQA